MVSRVAVKDNKNMIIGFIDDIGDKKIATHFSKGYAGYYWKNVDKTFDKNGRLYSYGDSTQSLIRDMEYNK